jgi:SPP1 family predicted phage head-tail adaptor
MTWRPDRPFRGGARFRVGAMRDRIQIQTATELLDPAGQTIRTWTTTYANEPSQQVTVRGSEYLHGGQVEAGVDEIFIIRFRDSIVPQMRVVFGSRIYGIVHVNEVESGRRYIELHCKAVI